MPTNRVTMRRIREALRLHLQAGLSYDEVGLALKISKSVVGKYVSLARATGVDWDVAQTLDDEALEARLYRPALPRSSHQLAPDFAVVHQELKRADVALMLLWEEYARDNALAYKYTSFCIKYREFARCQLRSMRQIHIAGEKLFVDYAGSTVPIVNALTGEISAAQIFVATLGASNYTFACATPHQTTADWIGAQVRARVHRWRAAPDRAGSDALADQAPRPLGTRTEPYLRGVRQALRLRIAGRPPGPSP
jgi:transposase